MFTHSDLETACLLFVHSSVLLVRSVIFISLQFPHAIRLAYMKKYPAPVSLLFRGPSLVLHNLSNIINNGLQ